MDTAAFIVGRNDRLIRLGFINADGITIKLLVMEEAGGQLEIHDGEEACRIILADACHAR